MHLLSLGVLLGHNNQHACRYDVELFQKIEALTGQKMESYHAEEDVVMLMLDRINEAQRMATLQVRGHCACVGVTLLSMHNERACNIDARGG